MSDIELQRCDNRRFALSMGGLMELILDLPLCLQMLERSLIRQFLCIDALSRTRSVRQLERTRSIVRADFWRSCYYVGLISIKFLSVSTF